ncbi:MAG: lipid II flippase MurJ [Gemmatimonadales bacterium]
MPRWWHPELVRALNLALPTLIALVLTNLVMGGVQRLVASGLEPGGLAAVNYAQRAVSLISGVTVSVATVSVTELSMRAATDASWQPTIDLLGRTLQASLYLLVPLAALVILVSDPLVTLLFVRGEYTAESASTTSACLRWLALSVAPSVIPAVLHRACSVFDRPWRVPLISLLWTASTVGATALLLQPLGAASLTAGHAVGIAAATLFSALAVREFVGTPFLLMLGRSFVRFSLFSLVAAVPAAMYLSLAHAEETGWSAGSAALGMVVASVIFMGAYAGLSYLVREPQLAAFWSAARALTSRSSNPI